MKPIGIEQTLTQLLTLTVMLPKQDNPSPSIIDKTDLEVEVERDNNICRGAVGYGVNWLLRCGDESIYGEVER